MEKESLNVIEQKLNEADKKEVKTMANEMRKVAGDVELRIATHESYEKVRAPSATAVERAVQAGR